MRVRVRVRVRIRARARVRVSVVGREPARVLEERQGDVRDGTVAARLR